MCGIAGIIGLEVSEKTMDIMLETMARRGPDSSGRYRAPGIALLHTRLAVIDPEHGTQPFLYSNGTAKYTMVYNGELYNTQELRRELEAAGHFFRTNSDTEVLLHAYAQWKESCLEKLNGIFAFAIWEEKENKLFVARDRMGVKPLFFKEHEGGYIFASEIKTILAYPSVRAELDTYGIMQILMLGPGRMPGSGVFHNIYELLPGHYGVYAHGKWDSKCYWRLKDGENSDSFSEAAEKVRYLVCDAIERQMVSDVSLGTFLSGGLDSSLITAIGYEKVKTINRPFHTFSVDYENNDRFFKPGKFQPESDNFYIARMRMEIDTQHHWSVLTPQTLFDQLEEAVYARDLPGMADVDSSLLAFCAEVRQHVKVALSGECADEIFGGYPWFRDPEVRDLDGFPWAQNLQIREELLHPAYKGRMNGTDFVRSLYRDSVAQADILPNTPQDTKHMKIMTYLNQNWFMQTLLERKDRMSMYHGLEVRVPFCDHRIAEYMYTVPWEYLNYSGREKGLLRYAMSGILPEEILWRKKSPYPKTYDPQYEKLVTDKMHALMRDNNAPIFQIANKSAIEQILQGESSWPWYGQLMKRPQTIAYFLMINMWLERYKIKVLD